MAVFFCCGGNFTFCTPCHNDAMANQNNIKSKCTGGPKCPLGLASHPKASTDKSSCFPMGCSLCRSEKLAMIAANEQASAGVNLEARLDMIERFDHVIGHDIRHEIKIENEEAMAKRLEIEEAMAKRLENEEAMAKRLKE